MEVTAMLRMEDFARSVLKLPDEMQAVYFDELVHSGIVSANEIKGLKEYVALFHMLTDPYHYRKVEACVCAMYLHSLNK